MRPDVPGESAWLDYEIDPRGCQSETWPWTIDALPSQWCDRAAPTLETHLGVRIRPQSLPKSLIEKSRPVLLIAGFPIPFGITLRMRECSQPARG